MPLAPPPPAAIARALDRAGLATTGRFTQIDSLENRVYAFECGDRSWKVVKLRSPARWSADALREEAAFVRELSRAAVPVVAPLETLGSPLGTVAGWPFSVEPLLDGQALEPEPDDETLAELGRRIADLHAVAAGAPALHRPLLTPGGVGRASLERIRAARVVPDALRAGYVRAAERVLRWADRLFEGAALHRIHADLHPGNVFRTCEGLRILDFDDFGTGPPLQDLWLLARSKGGSLDQRRLDVVVRAYRERRALPEPALALLGPLRALRRLWASAWIADRRRQPLFPAMFPRFRTCGYWTDEIAAWSRLQDRH